jgi:UDP-N-acetylmuramoyl-L-alanyl-D-glutamate--2,6-diaminopimelate ligase
MFLAQLLTQVPAIRHIHGDTQLTIRAVTQDSRKVQSGDCFVAVRGAGQDGHLYISKAIDRGASAVVCDSQFDVDEMRVMHPNITFIQVDNSAEALGVMASAFYNHPSRRVKLIGVTGTNGKTSVSTLLWQCFTRLGYKCGLIGTVENRIGDQVVPSTHTTPSAEAVSALLNDMANAGCVWVFMEVSSHAVHQYRVAGQNFVAAVFTNLTHDHLDYHGTFAAYRDAKKGLFDHLSADAVAITNIDDRNGAFMLQNTKARTRTYGLKKSADYKAKIIENALTGLHLQINGAEMHARMIGNFNAYNLLAVYAVCMEMGVEPETTLTIISDLKGAEGRFEYILYNGVLGIVDYAHTPDALEQVLDTITKLKKKGSRIITVTGAGGDRDKTKRPLMARICAQFSDQLILTSDNPRTESPAVILQEMEAGLDAAGQLKNLTIENREQAIKTAVRMAQPGDIILVAGKGHEKYQDIMGVKHPFDDKAVLEQYLLAQPSAPLSNQTIKI